MMLASWLVKWRQSLGQFVLQASAWLLKWSQSLGQFVLQASASRAVGPKPYPADAHDARLLARQMAPNHWGSLFCKRLGLRGPWSQNPTQLMLMMLASWLVKWPQPLGLRGPWGQNPTQLMLMMLASRPVKWPRPLGQFVLQTSWASGSVGPKPSPAHAHDARLLARQMAPITGAVCSASVCLAPQMEPITGAVCSASVWGFGGREARTYDAHDAPPGTKIRDPIVHHMLSVAG